MINDSSKETKILLKYFEYLRPLNDTLIFLSPKKGKTVFKELKHLTITTRNTPFFYIL